MNPAIVFRSGYGLGIIARVTPDSVAPYVTSPLEFKKLLHGIADIIQYNTDENAHLALPIGPELSGRWVAASPMGQEYANPPYMWEFETRVNNALTSPIHSLIIYPDNGFRDDAAELDLEEDQITALHEASISAAIKTFLGDNALVTLEHEVVRTHLDDILDGDWSSGGDCTG